MRLGNRLGVELGRRLGGLWFYNIYLEADDTLPDMVAEFCNNRYAVNQTAKSFDQLITFTRSSTATYFDSAGVMQTAAIDEHRFDHDPVTNEPLGLLVEDSSTNQLLHSEDLSNSAWTKVSVPATVNTQTAPDGTLSMDTIIPSTSNFSHYMFQNSSITSGVTYTQTLYVKADGYTIVQLTGSAGFPIEYVNFNLSTGTIGANNLSLGIAEIQDIGGGIYRISLTMEATSSQAGGRFLISPLDADTAGRIPSFPGDGVSGVSIWGCQLEVKDFPTSYIPTTSAAVTRAKDNALIGGAAFSDWHNASEGTIYIDQLSGDTGAFRRLLNLNTDSSNFITMVRRQSPEGIKAEVGDGGVTQAGMTVSGAIYDIQSKSAMAYKVNDFSAVLNGGTVTTDTSGTVPTVNKMQIGADVGGGTPMDGHIKSIRFYPFRVSNTGLQDLTASVAAAFVYSLDFSNALNSMYIL